MALLFITHDIALASGLADRIAVFRDGRLVEEGGTGCRRSRRLHRSVHARPDSRRLARTRGGVAMNPLLVVDGLRKSFRRGGGEIAALDGVGLSIDPRRDACARRPVRQRQIDARRA